MAGQQAPAWVIETEPDTANIAFLEECLYQFNVQATGIADGKLLAIFLRSAADTVIGGAYGWSWGGTCHLRYLFIPGEMRRQGRGRLLMQAIETEARVRGCGQIVLETHDFQAPGFYRKLGFAVIGTVEGYPRGYSALTMVKRLRSATPLD